MSYMVQNPATPSVSYVPVHYCLCVIFDLVTKTGEPPHTHFSSKLWHVFSCTALYFLFDRFLKRTGGGRQRWLHPGQERRVSGSRAEQSGGRWSRQHQSESAQYWRDNETVRRSSWGSGAENLCESKCNAGRNRIQKSNFFCLWTLQKNLVIFFQ